MIRPLVSGHPRRGKLAESWGVADRFDMLQQLGIIPSDDQLAAKMPKPD